MARKLRIAVSVFFGLMIVAFCVLWVRTFSHQDFFGWSFSASTRFTVNSEGGRIAFSHRPAKGPQGRQGFSTLPIDSQMAELGRKMYRKRETIPGFGLRRDAGGVGFHMPYWFAITLAVTLVAAPWVQWNFSLRTPAHRHDTGGRRGGDRGVGWAVKVAFTVAHLTH